MIVGMTGTRSGVSAEQVLAMVEMLDGASALHHGDCVGADAAAHRTASTMHVHVVVHPPSIITHRAFCRGSDVVVLEPRPYLVRNKEIVRSSEIVWAFPSGPEELRSGTWSTVRFARKTGVPVVVVYPDGSRGA